MSENINIVELAGYLRTPIVDRGQDGELPYAFVPDGYKRESLELNLAQPTRKRANTGMDDTPSFIAYINRHKTISSVIYAHTNIEAQSLQATCVLDDHDAGNTLIENGAHWGEHKASFTPEKTLEWSKWNLLNGKKMSQTDFANFIEDNLPDIQSVDNSPSGSDMLKMALNFEATYDKRFISKVNNQSGGITMEFKSTDDKETVTRMDVFSRFTLGLTVFIKGAAYPLQARLKYMAKDGALQFWYELVRPDRVFIEACANELATIQAGTEVLLLNGKYRIG